MLGRTLLLVLVSCVLFPACPAPDPDRDQDGSPASKDCDDNAADVYPGAPETCGDGIDQDCDGADSPCIDDSDWDGDGFASEDHGGTDCNDTRADVYPGAEEVPYDGVDQDCTGQDLTDVDGDGVTAGEVGGDDCDDGDPSVYPGASEVPYDQVDQDCDGSDLVDVDGDGYVGTQVGGDDCEDDDGAVYPGAAEIGGNGVDENCDGLDELDRDGDGYGVSIDCDDDAAWVYPGAPIVTCNDVDEDCDGRVEDPDCDGVFAPPEGDDCDDSDAEAYPGASVVGCNDVDEDCDGRLEDLDCDGHMAADVGGDDCDDLDPDVNPDRIELMANGVDDDCDGVTDQPLSVTDAHVVLHGEAGNRLGASVASADIDGDGISDLIVGTPGRLNSAGVATGAVLVYLGAPGILRQGLSEPVAILYGAEDQDAFGSAVAVGRFHGDGRPRLVVGAPGHGVGGAIYLVEVSTLPESSSVTDVGADSLVCQRESGGFGSTIASVQDVSGDGRDELIVGAPSMPCQAGDNCGAAYVFLGSTLFDIDSAGSADFIYYGKEAEERAGTNGGAVGDVDSDGVVDLAFSSPGADSGLGVIFVLRGRDVTTGWSESSLGVVYAENDGDSPAHFGPFAWSGGIGDSGGGGVWVGTPGSGAGAGEVGLATVPWFGAQTDTVSLESLQEYQWVGQTSDSAFGAALALSDYRGLGAPQLLVAAPGYDGGRGRLYLLDQPSNGATGAYSGASVLWDGSGESSVFGLILASGDLLGDGTSDLMIGLPDDSSAGEAAGSVLVYLF